MFIKDSSGNKSLTATMAVVSFVVVMVKVLLSGASLGMGPGITYSFGSIDAAMIAAIFTPILSVYLGRRWGDPAPSDAPGTLDAGAKPHDGAA